jgi:hypothetical protein
MNPEPTPYQSIMTTQQTYQLPKLEFLGTYSQAIGQIGGSITKLPSLEET